MGQLLGLNLGANQYTGPTYSAKKCFIGAAGAGNITTTVNKGRRAMPMSSLLPSDVYGVVERHLEMAQPTKEILLFDLSRLLFIFLFAF